MSVVFDAVATVGILNTSTTVSFNLTVGAGSDRAMAVGLSAPFPTQCQGVTYGGVALTKVTGASGALPVDGDCLEMWASVGFQPATGSANVVITYAASQLEIIACAVSVTGADQTNCVSASNFATGTSTTPSVTVTTAADELIYAHVCGIANASSTVGTNETERYDSSAGANSTISAHGYTQLGSDGGVMAPTLSVSSEWGIGALSFKAVTASSAAITGTGGGGLTETDVVTGSKTLIVTLTGATFIAN